MPFPANPINGRDWLVEIINSFMANNKRVILLAISLCLQVYKLIKLRKSISVQAKLIGILKDLDLLCIQDLKAKVLNGVYKMGDLVLCHGGLSSSESMASKLRPETPVAYSELIIDRVLHLGSRTKSIKRKVQRLFGSYLKMESFGDSINIYETVGTKLIPAVCQRKLNAHGQPKFGLSWLLRLLFKGPSSLGSFIYTEAYIPKDYYSLVLGRIQGGKNGEVFMRAPTAIAPSKEVMLNSFVNSLGNNWILFCCLLGLSLATLFFFVKFFLKTQTVQKLLRDHSSKKLFDTLQRIFVKGKNCKNCNEALSSHVREPCGHLNICQRCEEKSQNGFAKVCSDCNKKVKRSVQIFPC